MMHLARQPQAAAAALLWRQAAALGWRWHQQLPALSLLHQAAAPPVLPQAPRASAAIRAAGIHSSSDSPPVPVPLASGALPPKPIEPGPEECCGRGCAECVWTVYWEDLKQHEQAMAALTGEKAPEDPFEALERRLAQQQQQQQPPQQQAQPAGQSLPNG